MPVRRIVPTLLLVAVLGALAAAEAAGAAAGGAGPSAARPAAGEVRVHRFSESDGSIREDYYTWRVQLRYKGARGAASDLSVRFTGGRRAHRVLVRDPGGVRAGRGCRALGPRRVRCRVRGRIAQYQPGAVFHLGGGDDVLRLRGRPRGGAARITGGPGDDRIGGSAGGDAIAPGPGDDVARGGHGADVFWGGSAPDGADDLGGGRGRDALSYVLRREGVHADFDAEADDGAAGEGDRLRADLEEVSGGDGDDLLEGDGRRNVLLGGHDGTDTLRGGDGDDLLRARGDAAVLEGGGGDDILTSSAPARLDGGSGHDVVNAGTGGATVAAADGESDEVRCGDPDGASAAADAQDIVLGCGPVTRSGPPAPRFVFGLGGAGETLRGLVARRLTFAPYGNRLEAYVGCSSDMPAPCAVRVTIRDRAGGLLDRARVVQPGTMTRLSRRVSRERRRGARYTLRLEGDDATGAPVVLEERDVVADTPVPLTWQGW